jgi:hypothetical protein
MVCEERSFLTVEGLLDRVMAGKTGKYPDLTGRGERIRTSDHMHPMHVRYQAALRPEGADYTEGTTLMTNHSHF